MDIWFWLPDDRWLGGDVWLYRSGTRRAFGYRRVFNKLSVKNWGTHDFPCPTLNLQAAAEARCVGVAFEFDDSRATEVIAYLVKREGKNFGLEKWM